MSRRNGDRARFQKDRRRKLRKRQRLEQLMLTIRARITNALNPPRVAGGE